MVLRLLFCQEPCECDDVCVDLLGPGPSLWRITIGTIRSHCKGWEEVDQVEESEGRLRLRNKGVGWCTFWVRKNGISGSECVRTFLNRKEYRDITRSRSVHLHETESECRGRMSFRFVLIGSERSMQ